MIHTHTERHTHSHSPREEATAQFAGGESMCVISHAVSGFCSIVCTHTGAHTHVVLVCLLCWESLQFHLSLFGYIKAGSVFL